MRSLSGHWISKRSKERRNTRAKTNEEGGYLSSFTIYTYTSMGWAALIKAIAPA